MNDDDKQAFDDFVAAFPLPGQAERIAETAKSLRHIDEPKVNDERQAFEAWFQAHRGETLKLSEAFKAGAQWQAARAASPVPALPPSGSPEVSAMLDSKLAEYGWPAHKKEAARAGYEAARAMLAASPPAPPTPQQAVAWQERQQLSVGGPWTGWYDSGQRPLDAPRSAHIGGIPVEWRPLYASPPTQQPAEATSDQIIELAGALEIRRILEAIKEVAKLHPADDMPTPFQSAWQVCCEEIFYRATGEQWHMDEDATRFQRAVPVAQPPQGAQQEPLSMSMFASSADYEAAVRAQAEGEKR